MPAPYSCPVLTYTTKTDKVDLVAASHINALQTEQIAQNNRLLNAIDSDGSLLSGAAFPSPALPSQMFYRTDIDTAYIRNAANSGWAVLTAPSNIQIFTSNGTFTAPTGITKVYLTIVGGGGGGATKSSNRGGGGAGGNYVINYPYTVSPGSGYSVTVGAGGAGGASGAENNGADGSSSVFNSAVTATGGSGGKNTGVGGVNTGTIDATNAAVGGYVLPGGNGFAGAGSSGNGGGSIIGSGGAGATSATGGSGAANSGGGGGGVTSDATAGSGGSGIVIVAY